MSTLIDQLKAERHRQGLSLQQLGERIGRKTYQAVWQWESGTHDPRLSNLDEWARGLGYEITLTRVGKSTEDLDALAAAVANGEGWPVEVEEK